MNFIFGMSGFAKEVDWLIHDIFINNQKLDFRPDYFVVEDNSSLIGSTYNKKEIISERDFLSKYSDEKNNIIIAIGNQNIKRKIANNIIKKAQNSLFPCLIHPDVSYDKRDNKIKFCDGIIICSKSVLTTNIKIGKYVHINLGCTIGHDVIIGDFSTLSPGVHISGNVEICENVFFGTGAAVIEKIFICSNVTIGAGAVVTKDITEPGTYVGVPAVKVK